MATCLQTFDPVLWQRFSSFSVGKREKVEAKMAPECGGVRGVRGVHVVVCGVGMVVWVVWESEGKGKAGLCACVVCLVLSWFVVERWLIAVP